MKKMTAITPQMRRTIRFIARRLGQIQMAGLKDKHRIRFKGRINIVTEVDERCERFAVRAIRRHFHQHQILGEEGGLRKTDSDFVWVIDPLDGTTNFAHGYPLFCVSIALVYKGVVQLGVIYEPNLDEFFYAERGRGATLNGKKIRVSQNKKLISSLLVTGFAYSFDKTSKQALKQFENFLKKCQAVRRDGVAAVDLAYTACGRYDGFWELGLWPWDIAAGGLLIEEAGGRVTRFDGTSVALDDRQVLASNGRIHQDMVKVLKS